MQAIQTEKSLEAVHVDFMNIAFDMHLQDNENKKKDKARRRAAARRAIEMHMEKKKLEAELKNGWDF